MFVDGRGKPIEDDEIRMKRLELECEKLRGALRLCSDAWVDDPLMSPSKELQQELDECEDRDCGCCRGNRAVLAVRTALDEQNQGMGAVDSQIISGGLKHAQAKANPAGRLESTTHRSWNPGDPFGQRLRSTDISIPNRDQEPAGPGDQDSSRRSSGVDRPSEADASGPATPRPSAEDLLKASAVLQGYKSQWGETWAGGVVDFLGALAKASPGPRPSAQDLRRWASALEAWASLPDTPEGDYDFFWAGADFLEALAGEER